MKISLVMPTWNAGPLLDEVLAAVERQTGAQFTERIAIDSGSSDGTQARLAKHGFVVHGIPQSEFDHGATRDRMVAMTSGEIVVLLTQDATPANEHWLRELVDCYRDPRVGAAYCKQIPRPDCNPILAQRLREWTAGRDDAVVQEVASSQAFEALAPLERLRVSAFDNVASSVRRSTWERHRFGRRSFGEDVAFGKRVVLAGERIVMQAKSVVIHSHNRSAEAEGRRIYCDHKNLRELFGVHVIPDRKALRAAVAWGERHFAEMLDKMDVPAVQKAPLRAWALDYAAWSAWGQYLGGNADRFAKRWWFTPLDRWLRRGI